MDISRLYTDPKIIDAIKISTGPAIINAGPGSGKTRFLCTKVAYLLCEEDVEPNQIVVCTFTEKAAGELKNRIKRIILEQEPDKFRTIDFEKLRIGTIHSIFQNLIEDYIIFAGRKSGITVLDELDRRLFIHNHLLDFGFDTYTIPSIKGEKKTFYDFDDTVDVFYEEVDEWTLTDFLCDFYDDIVDYGIEITGIEKLKEKFAKEESFCKIIDSYSIYKSLLLSQNYLDFSQIQNTYWEMLQNEEFRHSVRSELRFVLVDEYQDTNYIQERALLESLGDVGSGDLNLVHFEDGEKYPLRNYTVVGDINQSLYRFRGAVIDNILTFKNKFVASIREYQLFANYRSTENIINLCNEYIGKNLSYYENQIGLNPKDFVIYPGTSKPNYPIISFVSDNRKTEGFVFKIRAFVNTLLKDGKIKSRNDIAILLPSIRYTEAQAFVSVFGKEIKLPAHLDFFSNVLVKCSLNAIASIGHVSTVNEFISEEFVEYYNTEIRSLNALDSDKVSLYRGLYEKDADLLGLFYSLLGDASLKQYVSEDNFRYIGLLSGLIKKYVRIFDSTHPSRFIREFIPFIYKNAEEIFEEEEIDASDRIKLMTIHQSKGLQYPIVIVGYNKSVNNRTDVPRFKNPRIVVTEAIDWKSVEEEDIAEEMELRRLFYVAFSRAKDLLVIGSRTNAKLNELSPSTFDYEVIYSDQNDSIPVDFEYTPEIEVEEKPSFSFTGDVETYNLCPKMYAFIKEFGMEVPEKDDFSFGKLVHQTIENINKHVLSSDKELSEEEILDISQKEFEKVFASIPNSEKLEDQKPFAYKQVLNYLSYFKPLLNKQHLHSVEESVSIDNTDYELKGRIDAVFKLNDLFIVTDIKSGKKSNKSEREIMNFEAQVKLYGSYYSKKYCIPVGLLIYSTGEKDYKDGEYIVSTDGTDAVNDRINDTIMKIINKNYDIDPAIHDIKTVCPNCPFNSFCSFKIQ